MALAVASSPPLEADALRELAAAQDGSDYREQAFYALVRNAREWSQSPAVDGEPIHLSFDPLSLNQRPADMRGELFRITGELVQQTRLDPPYEDVAEWFVRHAHGGEPVIVYVVGSDSSRSIKDRQHVQIDARFYKRMRFTARDRQARDYPAFVGRFPIALLASSQPASQPLMISNRGLDLLGVIAGPVVLLLLVFAGLRVWVARKKKAIDGQLAMLPRWNASADEVDDASGLPDDPAEALAELRRRAEQQ